MTAPRPTTGLVAVLLIMAALITGCGVQRDASYKTAADLKGAAVRAGYDCPSWSDDEPETTEPHPFDSGRCLSDNRDQFQVYPDQATREAATEGDILGTQLMMSLRRVEMVLLVGPNWTIRGPAAEVRELQSSLGGYLPDLGEVRVPGLGNF